MKNSAQASNLNRYGFASAGVPLFQLGRTVVTPGALVLLDHTGINASTLLTLHQIGDFGDIDEGNLVANSDAVRNHTRIVYAYVLMRNLRIWIITEANRSVTTLLPKEY